MLKFLFERRDTVDNNLHKDHRQRVKKEFLRQGFSDSTPPHKILEMLLFYSIPRSDTNETAHLLLEHFGSISGVLDADINELKKIKGVGENTAILLKLMVPVIRRYINGKTADKNCFQSVDEVGEFLMRKYMGFSKEIFAITSFDNKGRLLGFDVISEGNLATVTVTTRSVVEKVIQRNAGCIVLSHNHPGGQATPSDTDIQTTVRLCEAIRNLNVTVIDHIILCDDDYVSLALSKQYRHIFK